MIDSELRRFIAGEIRRELNVILSGVAGSNDDFNEVIEQLFPGMPSTDPRPVMQPFGLSSRAPKGTLQVNGRMGEHKGNRIVLGHRDKNKPKNEEGETVLYDAYGGQLLLRKKGVELTSQGIELVERLIDLVKAIKAARTNTLLGPQPLINDPVGIPERATWDFLIEDLTKLKGGVSAS